MSNNYLAEITNRGELRPLSGYEVRWTQYCDYTIARYSSLENYIPLIKTENNWISGSTQAAIRDQTIILISVSSREEIWNALKQHSEYFVELVRTVKSSQLSRLLISGNILDLFDSEMQSHLAIVA